MSAARVDRLLPGSDGFSGVLAVWENVYGAPDPDLAERLGDERSLLWALRDGTEVGGFVHFRDRKGMLLSGPGADESSRLLAESPEFATYGFEQLYFAGGRWTLDTAVRPIFEAVEAHLRGATLRWVLLGHLHSDRRYFAETAAMLERLGFHRRPGDYVTWRLRIAALAEAGAGLTGGPVRWRHLGDDPPPPPDDLVSVYAEVFPDDPPEAVLRDRLERGAWGPLSGVAYIDAPEEARAARICCTVPRGGPPRPAGVVLARSVEPNVLAVDRLGVSAAHRRRGVSAAGFAAFAARCAAAGVETLEFQVRASNAAATALVADRLGARRVKEERFYVKTGWGGTAADQSAEPGGSGAA